MANNMNQRQSRWQEQLWHDSHTQDRVSLFPMQVVSPHATLAKKQIRVHCVPWKMLLTGCPCKESLLLGVAQVLLLYLHWRSIATVSVFAFHSFFCKKLELELDATR